MEIREGWIVVIAIAVLIFGLWIGSMGGRDGIASDCKLTGKFVANRGEVFACSPVGKPAEQS